MNEVVMLKRLVTRGKLINTEDDGLKIREIRKADEYIREPAQEVGKLARRPLAASISLTPAMLSAPLLVRRGQQVVIVAITPGIDVRMQGTALIEGGAGDRLHVRNETLLCV